MNNASNSKDEKPRANGKRGNRSRRFKVAAILFSLLVACLICEVSLRILLGAPLSQKLPVLHIQANPHRGWAMMPDTTHFAYHHPVHINNLGLRGDDIGNKQPNEVRILALGDSMVFGQGIADDQTLPVFMQARLNERKADPRSTYTVINGGLRSYSTNQELGLLEELGPTIKPDVVVVFWYWNDVIEHSIAEHNHRFSQTGPVAFDTKSKLEGWTKAKWRGAQVLRHSALLMWLHDSVRALRSEPVSQQATQAAFQRLDGYLSRFHRLAQANGFQLYFAVIPDPNSLKRDHPSTEFTLLAQTMAQKHGIPSYDLLDDALDAYDGGIRLPTVPYDGHYSGEANRSMAHGIVKFLKRQIDDPWPRATW